MDVNEQILEKLKKLDELVSLDDFEHFQERLENKLNNAIEMTQKHERVLYRQNGTPGYLEKVDQLDTRLKGFEKEREENAGEWRKLRYTLLGSGTLLLVDIILRFLIAP